MSLHQPQTFYFGGKEIKEEYRFQEEIRKKKKLKRKETLETSVHDKNETKAKKKKKSKDKDNVETSERIDDISDAKRPKKKKKSKDTEKLLTPGLELKPERAKENLETNENIDIVNFLKIESNIKTEELPQISLQSINNQSFYNVLLENHKTTLDKKFWRKLDAFLRVNDFELPALNREKYTKWPLHLPTLAKIKELQKTYPGLTTRGNLSEKKSNKVLRRFDRLVDYFGYDKENGGRNKLMDKLHNKKYFKTNLRYKALVAAYVAGPKLLHKRFVRDIWNRLEALIRQPKPKYDKEKLYETVQKAKKENVSEPFLEARKCLGLTHSQAPLNLVKKAYYRTHQGKMYEKTNKLTLEEKALLILEVFKFLKVKNISAVPRNCGAPWKEIAVELDKDPDFLLRYWERHMYPKLLAHEELNVIFEDHSYVFTRIAECVIEDGRPFSKISVPDITDKVRYSNTNTVGTFVKRIARKNNGLNFQANMHEELQKLKMGQASQLKIKNLDLNGDMKLTEIYDQFKNENKFDF